MVGLIGLWTLKPIFHSNLSMTLNSGSTPTWSQFVEPLGLFCKYAIKLLVLEIKKIQAQTFGLILHQAHSKAPLLEVPK